MVSILYSLIKALLQGLPVDLIRLDASGEVPITGMICTPDNVILDASYGKRREIISSPIDGCLLSIIKFVQRRIKIHFPGHSMHNYPTKTSQNSRLKIVL